MLTDRRVAVILPALDERGSVESVVGGFLAQGARVFVVDNGSTDGTAEAAARAGADVVVEMRLGYGSACLAGIERLARDPPEFVVFADCDGTLDPSELTALLDPLLKDCADLVLGRRSRIEPGAMPRHQRFGNRVVCLGLRLFHGIRVRDVSPYRAVRWSSLAQVRFRETTYGFPVETVVLLYRAGSRTAEVDVSYNRRSAGVSKVAGSLPRAIRAGLVMIALTVRLRFRRSPA